MELNKIKFLINSNGTYLDTILPPITANEDGRTIVQVIAPFPITDIVSVNYSIRPIQATVKGSYLVPTGKFGKDVLADDYTHFQTVADWNVFEIPINAVALEYISKYRAGLVLVSFAITQLQTPYFATNYLGLFSNTQPIPATSYNDGDYFIANEYNFTAHDITWAKGDYAYFYNGKWNKGKSVLKASTPSIELPVDPSLKDAPQLEYDEDVALLLANDLGLLTQRVSQAETDVESAKNDINEIDGRVGVNETDIYNLESDVGNLQSDKADKTELVPIISELERLENEKVDLSLYTYDKGLQNTRDNAQENRLDTVEIDVANLENQNLLHSPTFNGTNGHLTFQRYGASPIVIDLPTEMIVTSGVYDDINNELVLNLASGGEVRIPVGNLLTDLDAENIRYNGAGTYYLSGKNRVEQAINELDLQVKAVNDNKLDASVYNNDIPLIDAELLRLEDDKANKSELVASDVATSEVGVSVQDKLDELEAEKVEKIETRNVGVETVIYENGKITGIISPTLNTTLKYGIGGNLIGITETYSDGKSYETTYTKDVEGRIKTMTKAEV